MTSTLPGVLFRSQGWLVVAGLWRHQATDEPGGEGGSEGEGDVVEGEFREANSNLYKG